jgi:hypothetical protein
MLQHWVAPKRRMPEKGGLKRPSEALAEKLAFQPYWESRSAPRS